MAIRVADKEQFAKNQARTACGGVANRVEWESLGVDGGQRESAKHDGPRVSWSH